MSSLLTVLLLLGSISTALIYLAPGSSAPRDPVSARLLCGAPETAADTQREQQLVSNGYSAGEENHCPPLDYSHTDSWVLVLAGPNGNQTRTLIACVCSAVSIVLPSSAGWMACVQSPLSLERMINCC